MSSVTFGQKVFTPKPPDKGSFPLDHEGECKQGVLKYLLCLKDHDGSAEPCRHLAKDYLECRMNRQARRQVGAMSDTEASAEAVNTEAVKDSLPNDEEADKVLSFQEAMAIADKEIHALIR
ncbi:hypothetical protein HPB51_006827 [Rhipicephalus microplus]|uniref:Cytochrome c oxidase assembly protein cox19 n=1 Tax=Rhipicephalus microplus TaxID=6941 RepID=A0A9J6E737_RHIMP|nr:hypothetical protein HPB51_006827 [Rhipicephalus microplus]